MLRSKPSKPRRASVTQVNSIERWGILNLGTECFFRISFLNVLLSTSCHDYKIVIFTKVFIRRLRFRWLCIVCSFISLWKSCNVMLVTEIKSVIIDNKLMSSFFFICVEFIQNHIIVWHAQTMEFRYIS